MRNVACEWLPVTEDELPLMLAYPERRNSKLAAALSVRALPATPETIPGNSTQEPKRAQWWMP